MFDHKNALGVPSWRNAHEYPDSDALTDSEWRWQFLRRRPDYRQAWLDYYDECQRKFDTLYKAGILDERDRYRSVGSTLRAVCEPFGTDRIPAPWLEHPGFAFWRPSFGYARGQISEHTPIDSLIDQEAKWHGNGVMFFAFDLNRPFEDQVSSVRRHFDVCQRERLGQDLKPKRQHKRKWLTYLRAIDARDQGATYGDLFLELELSKLLVADYDAALDRNLAASGLQLFNQAIELMFKVTS